jgi:hypothetical protein
MQLLLLWYPYLTSAECADLAAAAPSSHVSRPQRLDCDHTWGEGDIAVMKHEFAALDTSGDGFVDRHVRLLEWLQAALRPATPALCTAMCTWLPGAHACSYR